LGKKKGLAALSDAVTFRAGKHPALGSLSSSAGGIPHRIATGPHTHQNAAVLDAFLVLFDAFFWNAPANERAYDAAGCRSGSRSGDCCGERAGDHEAKSGEHK
jgi:hypothetical protein